VINALSLRHLPVSHPENLVRVVEVHPNGLVSWDLPYDLCGTLASRDASLDDVICQGEADVALKDGGSTERAEYTSYRPISSLLSACMHMPVDCSLLTMNVQQL
jgi:hypothetical protein